MRSNSDASGSTQPWAKADPDDPFDAYKVI
jgi:hypothetical protein